MKNSSYFLIAKKTFSNPIIGFVGSRYLTYGVQFINSILIAVYLGPAFLGIWGFILLIIQYLAQLNLGIAHSVNIIASIKKHQHNYVSLIIGNSVINLFCLSAIIAMLFYLNDLYHWNIGEKYNFEEFDLYVLLIAVNTYFISLFSNVFRIYGKLFEVAFSESAIPVATLLVLLFFRDGNLLNNLVYTYASTSVLSLLLFVIRLPIKIKINFNKRLWWIIQKKGWYLFLYNSSFYLIIISVRSFVSHYYSVEEFGYFTFSFSLANVFLLLLGAFTFLIWPKLLNSLSKLNPPKSFGLIQRLRKVYLSVTHGLLHCGIFLFPYFLTLLPQYSDTFKVFGLIAVTIILQTNTFGYLGLLIAKGKEKKTGYLALGTLLLNVTLCYTLITIFKVDFHMVILATMLSYLFYGFVIGLFGRKLLGIKFNFLETIKDIFPIPIMAPLSITIFFLLFNINEQFFIFPLFLFVLLNISKFRLIIHSLNKIIFEPKSLDI